MKNHVMERLLRQLLAEGAADPYDGICRNIGLLNTGARLRGETYLEASSNWLERAFRTLALDPYYPVPSGWPGLTNGEAYNMTGLTEEEALATSLWARTSNHGANRWHLVDVLIKLASGEDAEVAWPYPERRANYAVE